MTHYLQTDEHENTIKAAHQISEERIFNKWGQDKWTAIWEKDYVENTRHQDKPYN